MNADFDFLAIGAGPAGESAVELAAFFGHRSAIVEKNRPGGTVTTTGGVPTKTLREAALYITGFRERDVYGLRFQVPPEIAADTMRRRTWRVCERLQQLTRENIARNNVEYIQGCAHLESDQTVVVMKPGRSECRIRARVILIATGSRPLRPTNIPFNSPGICDTDTILHRGAMPRDILIVGGGPVGVEFATICHALGARVTLVDRAGLLLAMMDAELSSRLSDLFGMWGVRVLLGATVDAVDTAGGGIKAKLSTGEMLDADTILFAGGRVANTEELGLEAAGVKLDKNGRIAVDAQFCTSVPSVYAAGDVLRPTLASIAMEQGRAAVCHAFGIPFEGIVDPTPVSAVFGMPELAGAGLTEEQCRESGLDYEAGRSDLNFTPRGAIAGRGGLLKLIFLKDSRRLVGVHCIGDIASELIGIGQMAIRCGSTLNTIANMSMNTPTYSYAYKYAAFDGLRRLAATRNRTGLR
jgi:NAD(P) transhydrogenase